MRLPGAVLCGIFLFASACLGASTCCPQDLAPRAYIITPIRSNAITLTTAFFDGSLILDGGVPITGASARFSVSAVSYTHSLSVFGRTVNFSATLPYGAGNFRGTVAEAETLAYRSGLLATSVRFSINLKGGPAMSVEDFVKWRQKTLLGVSLRVVPPTGQYDATKLVNLGSNRWAWKPELGYSRRWGHWILDAYGGVWLFTNNPEFFSNNQFTASVHTQSQSPTGSFEGHLSYDFKPRLWISLDGNYWFGGKTSVDGLENSTTLQRNSRVGVTTSFPLTSHQSLKLSYNSGAYVKYGGNYQNITFGWQYSWLGRPN